MLAVISPAKKLNLEPVDVGLCPTQPRLLNEASILAKQAKQLSVDDLRSLMGISPKLAALNYDRFQSFSVPFTKENATPAALTFNGDTYLGLDAPSLSTADLEYAQEHLGILSGLYGLLLPLDLIQPYRLEMGASFGNPRGADLYSFWGDTLTEQLNSLTEDHENRTLVNLASNEYFKAVKPKKLAGPLVTPIFKEVKGGKARVISFMAKRARGMMARYIIEERVDIPEGLKRFKSAGYEFQAIESDDSRYVFSRPQPPPVR
jgi:cytoplasmic iron level regulating protein YaaA (DUF328/UPF0246 family)